MPLKLKKRSGTRAPLAPHASPACHVSWTSRAQTFVICVLNFLPGDDAQKKADENVVAAVAALPWPLESMICFFRIY